MPERQKSRSHAYEVPLDPEHPEEERWCSTLVRPRPVLIGERLRLRAARKVGDPISPRPDYYGPEREWEVVAIEPTSRDGQEVGLRGWGLLQGWGRSDSGEPEPRPIMRGKLVLRPVE
jgi:hypothetical protein